MKTKTSFWDRIADKYASMPIADEVSYRIKLDKTREYFQPDSVVLEFGCGTGGTALSHAPYVKQIDAIDLSARMLEKCEQKRQQNNIDNVHFQQHSIESLPLQPGHYNVVMGMSILHLVDDVDAVIHKVYQLLKPGGYFISSTICLGDVMPLFRFIAPLGYRLGLMPKVSSLKAGILQQHIVNAGFQLDHHWQPKRKAATFLIMQKPM
ncbi:MAG: class I SAM-dependent methyltransferase [Reinekea sp.]|jgi:2-polyprenyl-3-methyl-5-hydroxy-6-metoxy-1,4-benzoquinol methylase